MRRRPLVVSLVGILVLAFGSLLATVIAGNKPQLGLDLQGGASVTLRPVGAYDSAALDVVPDIYRSRIDSLGVAEPEIIRQGDTIVVNLPGVKDKERAIELIGVTGKVLFRPVLAQSPLAAPIDLASIPATSPSTIPTTTVVGSDTTVAGTDTTVAGSDTSVADTSVAVATSAPSTTVASSVTTVAATTTTAKTQGFAMPKAAAASTTAPTAATTVPASSNSAATTVAAVSNTNSSDSTLAGATTVPGETTTTVPGETTTTVPFDPVSLITPNDADLAPSTVVLPNRTGTALYQLGPAFALGEQAISSASAQLQNGQWTVELVLKGGAQGLDAWNAMTAKCYSKATECPDGGMAIVLDHRVISAPVPQTTFFSSPNVEISGGGKGFTEKESSDLARVLKYGGTPIEMKPEAAQTVSATLGKDSLHAGVIAGIVGIALVVLLMFLYYRSLALVVLAGLLVSASILWSIISLLSKTSGLALTLAGVTGIIVSIGVTVDSYVVFFERLKDEVRGGRSLKSSAQRGFKSAWRTILAADTVSLIGASVLWYLSVGSVRGFAFFLGLSTLCDVVVAYFFTRPAVLLLSRTARFQNHRVLGVETGEALAGGVA